MNGYNYNIIIFFEKSPHFLTFFVKFRAGKQEIITVKSCEDALKHLYQGIDPVYIILDIVIPESDGWVTYKRIKGISDLHNVPIAFLTVSDDSDDIKRAREMGAVDYIKKPTSKDELLGKNKKALP